MRTALLLLLISGTALAGEITLSEALRDAEEHYPTLAAAKAREAAADSAISTARAGYLPTIDAEAIESTGFPASTSALGIGGIMGSPYRSGVAGGLVLKQTLWDFGRTGSAVDAAKSDLVSRREDTKVVRYAVDRNAATVFFECGRFRSQVDVLKEIETEAYRIVKEVGNFVRTGQRSVVDRLLAESQAEEAAQARAGYAVRMDGERRRLALITGLPEKDVACPRLPSRATRLDVTEGPPVAPLIGRAQADSDTARARLDEARSGHLPRLVGLASVGVMQKSRLEPVQDYALGVGLVIPLFDGWRTTSEVERAEATARAKELDLDSAKQQLAEWNTRYDEQIGSSRARLEHLDHELKISVDGFQLAKERYLSFRGPLVDVRETLRNLSRTQAQTNDVWADLLEATAAKAFGNGAGVKETLPNPPER